MTLHGDRKALDCSSCGGGVSCAVPACSAGARGSAHVEVNLVTALVPSDTACLASSPGRMSRTAVCHMRSTSASGRHCCCATAVP